MKENFLVLFNEQDNSYFLVIHEHGYDFLYWMRTDGNYGFMNILRDWRGMNGMIEAEINNDIIHLVQTIFEDCSEARWCSAFEEGLKAA